jgi:hypothetical protein
MNKYLLLKNGVVLTEHISPVIDALDKYFEEAGLVAYVTSGLRTPEDQLRIIQNQLKARVLDNYYPEAFGNIGGKYNFQGQSVYNWQPGWSKLLSVGFIVNPPYPAHVLMDYYRPGSSENKKGQLIGDSPHTKGTAFDVSGGGDGVTNEALVIERAKGKVKGLKGYLIERNNNAIHVDCYPNLNNT